MLSPKHTVEIDGVVRRVPLIVNVNGETYPAIAIEVIVLQQVIKARQVKANEGGIEKVPVSGYS